MRREWTTIGVAIAMALAGASDAAAKAGSRSKKERAHATAVPAPHRGPAATASHRVRGRVAYAPEAYRAPRAKGRGFVDIVGDPHSGYGFYPLPVEIRIAAARYRQGQWRAWWQNPVLSAIAADALGTRCFIPANQAYRCGVFNPIDGVGTPFFAGYYR